MGQLRALQEELSRLLFVGSKADSSRFWQEGLPQRLQVYRNTVHGNAYDTLDSDYPLTQKQFSEDAWFDVSQSFFTQHPPAYWELNTCIKGFPAFLRKQKVKPYIVELAQYELLDLMAYVHTSTVEKHLGRSNPTAIPQVFQYQMADWVIAEGDPKKIPAQKPEVLVFYRDTQHLGRVRRADPLLLLLLDHFSKPGAELEDAEPIRAKLLPQNRVPLDRVLKDLIENDLILL
jgi:hypothetical protein